MAIPRTMIAPAFVTASLLLFLSVPRLVAYATQRSDIWWTPKPMAVAPAQGLDRAEIYVAGEPLPLLLESGRVLLKTGTGVVPVKQDDVKVRFNNWDRVRAQGASQLLMHAGGAGAGAVFLAIALFGVLDQRKRT